MEENQGKMEESQMKEGDQEFIEFLSQVSPFEALDKEEITNILLQSSVKAYKKNEKIRHDFSTPPQLYLVIQGLLKNYLIRDDGQEMTVKFFYPGELVGIISALTKEDEVFSLEAVQDSKVLIIPQSIFERLLGRNPAFAEEMTRNMSQRLRLLYKRLQQERSFRSITGESYPFGKRLGEIMVSPVIQGAKEISLPELAQLFQAHGVSSVLITENQRVLGIVTEKDLMKVIADRKPIDSLRAADIMSAPVITLDSDALFFEALIVMMKQKIKHIPIVDRGYLVGIVTLRTLLDVRGIEVLSVVKEIEEQTTIQGLVRVKPKVSRVLESLLSEGAGANEICHIISECNDSIVRRILKITEEEMAQKGYGYPPVDYCWLAMGSEGRKEQTLSTDQDNAIIYEDIDDKQLLMETERYFQEFSNLVVANLELCGFPRCQGNVMASNPRWRNTLTGWKDEIKRWRFKLEGDEIRQFTIFLDCRGVYGNVGLYQQLRAYLTKQITHHEILHFHLARDNNSFSIPIGLFGRLLPTKNENKEQIDLKTGGVMHIVNCLRIFAAKYGVSQVTTMDRLKHLHHLSIFTGEETHQIESAFNILMLMRIRLNMEQVRKGLPLSNVIDISDLSKNELLQLKEALSTAKWVKQMTSRRFHVIGG
ncbi:DUF294 nucleotidyltransferase-like domain-containing protein [Microaerobacter geothermalis]|uniref:DUF294 nucleotidyltransferase-like domain-containing protein n=1 Tax=Microaerobacter geothermalis TaxID=674972 RepID=UPI001F26DDC1|nr:DUF294 nucleotidyltransferase-like domain-containing protein [Microaerobacter geothermalis]MCF6094980.1 DUF294 nucleotidyltransferase-like domain-containing protein [Microaerobacter geothermalis]